MPEERSARPCYATVTATGVLEHLTHPRVDVSDDVLFALLMRNRFVPWTKQQVLNLLPDTGRPALVAMFRLVSSQAILIHDRVPADDNLLAVPLNALVGRLVDHGSALLLDTDGFPIAGSACGTGVAEAWSDQVLRGRTPDGMRVTPLYLRRISPFRLVSRVGVHLEPDALLELVYRLVMGRRGDQRMKAMAA